MPSAGCPQARARQRSAGASMGDDRTDRRARPGAERPADQGVLTGIVSVNALAPLRRKRAKDRRDRRLQARPADAVACRLRQAGRAVRYHRRRSAPASASPSRGPGNGILWAETGGRFQPQNAGERPEFGLQTATRLTNRPELRGFLPARKPRRFAGTVWWRTQSRQTGLRDRARLGNREKHTAMADNAFFWGVQTASFRAFRSAQYQCLQCVSRSRAKIRRQQHNSENSEMGLITRLYNGLSDPEPIRSSKQNPIATWVYAAASYKSCCLALRRTRPRQ